MRLLRVSDYLLFVVRISGGKIKKKCLKTARNIEKNQIWCSVEINISNLNKSISTEYIQMHSYVAQPKNSDMA